ncbi:hypothetical protein [Hyphomonas johnsonii]|uniref:Uncharacterized protein n=1 Tax=Hyphomonas johnsonii MHS-2 TaxID=1280950 RepID=A0A059FNE4_9PROT|nr:hypothetical protein [Hyphomonas johnsonii]KCZ92210.1 hypothetical protein HJO_09249 [Hyphomonas johnsonii MHS-2]
MSDSFLSSLPRFDRVGAPMAVDKRRLLLGKGPAPVETATDEEPEEEAPAPDDHAAPTGIGEYTAEQAFSGSVARVPEFEEIEILLKVLSDTIDKVEQQSRDHTVQVIQAMASRLFPELARQFLAEEIGRHLPIMIPASVQGVEIHAQPEMADKLQKVIDHSVSLAERCSFVPVTDPDDAQVRISWGSGGLTFDFDRLMQACLAQLNSTQATIDE